MKTLLPSKTSNSSSFVLATLLLRTGLLSLSNLPPTLLSLSSPPDSAPLNSVLSAFARNRFPSLALSTLSLIHRLSLPLDSYSLCSSLSAAASSSQPSLSGHQIQAVASKTAFLSNVFVCGALIDFYTRTASLQDARNLFDESPVKNTVCANSLLHGYVESKLWDHALSLFRTMQLSGLTPDEVTLSAVLRICADAAVVGLGRQAQGFLIRSLRGMGKDVILLSCLVEMYGKCGLVEKARTVFELASKGTGGTDVFLWTSMLNVYGRNGRFDDVIRVFEEMLDGEKAEPDHVAFLAVISACSRSGNAEKGLEFLELMGRRYGLVPGPEHYGCVIDMLCRAGELEEVWMFANEMAVGNRKRFGVSVWGAILSACRDCGNVEIGVAAAQKGLELDPGNVGILVELSNLYAKVGMWNEIGELREVIKERGLKKDAGSSWLELVNCDKKLLKAEVIRGMSVESARLKNLPLEGNVVSSDSY